MVARRELRRHAGRWAVHDNGGVLLDVVIAVVVLDVAACFKADEDADDEAEADAADDGLGRGGRTAVVRRISVVSVRVAVRI